MGTPCLLHLYTLAMLERAPCILPGPVFQPSPSYSCCGTASPHCVSSPPSILLGTVRVTIPVQIWPCFFPGNINLYILHFKRIIKIKWDSLPPCHIHIHIRMIFKRTSTTIQVAQTFCCKSSLPHLLAPSLIKIQHRLKPCQRLPTPLKPPLSQSHPKRP